jgi:hypothetical protein
MRRLKKETLAGTSELCVVSAKKTYWPFEVFPKVGHTLEKPLNSPGVS